MADKPKLSADVLHDIQQNLSVPKGQFNNFGKYRYRSCEDIVEAVKKIMPIGLVLLLTDEVVQLGDRYYVKATATLTNYDGVFFEAAGWAREPEAKKGMDESQITGTASSYARKYALNGLFCIDDTKDADATRGVDAGKADKSTKRTQAKPANNGSAKEKAEAHEAAMAESHKYAVVINDRFKAAKTPKDVEETLHLYGPALEVIKKASQTAYDDLMMRANKLSIRLTKAPPEPTPFDEPAASEAA